MTTARRFAGEQLWARLREGLRHPFRSWTLRRKLVLTIVAVVAVLGLLIGWVSVALLNGYLINRVDSQLKLAITRADNAASQSLYQGQGVPSASSLVQISGQPGGTIGVLLRGTTWIDGRYLPTGSDTGAKPISDESRARLMALPTDDHPTTISLNLGGQDTEYRVAAVLLPDQATTLVMGLPMAEAEATTARLVFIMVIVTAAAGLASAGAALIIIQLSLRPLDRVADAATTVSTLPLDRGEVALAVRVEDEDTDTRTEVGRVGSAFNAMLGHVASALQARESSERKVRQFVSDASHELRTPLASIRGYSELTRRSGEEIPPDVQHAIGRIESEAKRMTAMVEDLLLLARLDEGRELDREPVDLSMLLINLLSDAHAAGPDHIWRLDLPEEPIEVIGDQPRLHQVFANLLTNARVHTPPGTTVTLALAATDDAAEVSVSDDGPGIPPELQPLLFERFARGDSSRSRNTGSTGLGLAIVRAVVDAHHGSIVVESEPGRTVFRVRLPRSVVG
ncbi:sensor histidine kinase [Gryllotalpicola ginsengisoli]|uniref:sensor histidine kinase n=1 Tax=Gryllotalpicola ginsengisoli TaxID=444608 RepID=UPI0003F9A18B|nr:ATP-binding protein [Gryllotalpicola ginsengisoli]